MFLTFVYGAVFSFISGVVAQVIAKKNNLKVNYVLFVIMVGFATFSLFKSDGSSWTQLLAIFVFAPISILGGFFGLKKVEITIYSSLILPLPTVSTVGYNNEQSNVYNTLPTVETAGYS